MPLKLNHREQEERRASCYADVSACGTDTRATRDVSQSLCEPPRASQALCRCASINLEGLPVEIGIGGTSPSAVVFKVRAARGRYRDREDNKENYK